MLTRSLDPGHSFCATQKCTIDIDLEKLRDNSAYHCVGAQVNPCLEKLEYPRNDIIYIKDLGQGAFGRVFQVDFFLDRRKTMTSMR